MSGGSWFDEPPPRLSVLISLIVEFGDNSDYVQTKIYERNSRARISLFGAAPDADTPRKLTMNHGLLRDLPAVPVEFERAGVRRPPPKTRASRRDRKHRVTSRGPPDPRHPPSSRHAHPCSALCPTPTHLENDFTTGVGTSAAAAPADDSGRANHTIHTTSLSTVL